MRSRNFEHQREKHFSPASDSDPFMPDTIASLSATIFENELGLKLFIRNPRRVELTEGGRGFLVEARRTLVSAQQTIAHAHELASGERGRLSIGVLIPLTYAFLNDALTRFRELFPLVEHV